MPSFDGMSGELAGLKMLNLASRGPEMDSLARGEKGVRVSSARPVQSGSAVIVHFDSLRQPAQAAWRLLYAALADSCSRAISSLPKVWRLRPKTPNAK